MFLFFVRINYVHQQHGFGFGGAQFGGRQSHHENMPNKDDLSDTISQLKLSKVPELSSCLTEQLSLDKDSIADVHIVNLPQSYSTWNIPHVLFVKEFVHLAVLLIEQKSYYSQRSYLYLTL